MQGADREQGRGTQGTEKGMPVAHQAHAGPAEGVKTQLKNEKKRRDIPSARGPRRGRRSRAGTRRPGSPAARALAGGLGEGHLGAQGLGALHCGREEPHLPALAPERAHLQEQGRVKGERAAVRGQKSCCLGGELASAVPVALSTIRLHEPLRTRPSSRALTVLMAPRVSLASDTRRLWAMIPALDTPTCAFLYAPGHRNNRTK